MSANSEAQGSGRGIDITKWIVVAVLLVVAIVGNYYFRQYNLALRAIAVVAVVAVAGAIALWTTKGKATLVFAREARTEMRKVIWPTRQGSLTDNINCCCSHRNNGTDPVGIRWYSGAFSFIPYKPEVFLRCQIHLKSVGM